MPLLSIEDLNVDFYDPKVSTAPPKTALHGVGLELEHGESLGIVGESGSGKSVLCLAVMRLLAHNTARVNARKLIFDGVDLQNCNANEIRALRGARMAMIFQDPMSSLNPYLRVETQLREAIKKGARDQKREKIVACLEEVGIPNPEQSMRHYPHQFSGGQQQRIMIAMALLAEPKLLIADEPTTALDTIAQTNILELIKQQQQKRGFGMLFISHDLAVIAQVAERIVVMEKGRAIEQEETQRLFMRPQHPYTQKLLASLPSEAKPERYRLTANNERQALLETRELSYNHRVSRRLQATVKSVSLALARGEILGLVGGSGSGKTTLAKTILRLINPSAGRICFEGNDISSLSERKLRPLRRNFQMIFQHPYASLNPRMTVRQILAEPLRQHRIVAAHEFVEHSKRLLDEVGLGPDALKKYPHQFSGGQCQRIAIARALCSRPSFTVADEPVSALDVTIQAQILELLLNLVQKHQLAMLFISHDLSVVRYIADRIAVMRQGEIVELGATEQVFNQPQHEYTRELLKALPKTPNATEPPAENKTSNERSKK